jgi:hypothetical protein
VFEMERTDVEEHGPGGRVPLATEILSYLGGAFAAAAVLALMGMFWDTLGAVGQLGLTGLVAVACLVGGMVIGRIDDRAARRLQQFLLFLGVAAIGGFAGIAAWHVADPLLAVPPDNPAGLLGPQEWASFFAFLTVAVVGGTVYWRYRFAGPQIAFGIGAAMTALTAVMLSYGHLDVPGWRIAIALLAVGLAWGAAGLRGMLPPGEKTALSVSGTMLLFGLFILATYSDEFTSSGAYAHWPLYTALAGALLLLGAGVALKRLVTIGVGAAGVVLFVPMLLGEVFASSITVPASILLLGVLLIIAGVGVAVIRRRPGKRPESEAAVQEAEAVAPPAPARKVPVVSEILGYIGGAFAMGAGIALIVGYADQIGIWGQITLCGVAAIVGLAGGFAIGRIEDKGAKRLEQFLLAVGATGSGAMVGLGVFRLVDAGVFGATGITGRGNAGDWAWFLGATTAAIVGGVAWRFRRTWMQQIVFGVAVALASVTVLGIPDVPGPTWVLGLVLAALGVVWGALGFRGWMEPANAALALGSLGIIGGCMAMAIGPSGVNGEQVVYTWALWAGFAASIALVVLGLRVKRYVLVGTGALGTFQFLPQLVQQVFPGEIAGPIAILVVGVVLIGGGVAFALSAQRKHAPHDAAT